MTKVQERTAVQATATVAPPYTRSQILRIAASAFAAQPLQQYYTINDVERPNLAELRVLSVDNTVLEPINTALAASAVVTDGTVGGIMDALQVDQKQLHNLICFCHEKTGVMSGESIAFRLNELAGSS